jgi:hypothetical protein
MRRIYLLLPNVHSAQMIISELLLLRVEWRHIHVTANHNVPLKDLPEAILTQRSDLLPALARGAAMGGLTGTLAGLVALAFPPAGLTIAGGAVVAITLCGAGFGAWTATMIGVDVPNSRLKRFEQAIEKRRTADDGRCRERSCRRNRGGDQTASRRGRHPGNGPDDSGVSATPRHVIRCHRNDAVRHDVRTNMNDRKPVVVRGGTVLPSPQ